MKNGKVKRAGQLLTAGRRAALARQRRLISRELPDLEARNQMRKEARDEPTLSGELRRAIHESPLSLEEIAAQAGVTPLVVDEFLTGERTLRSDVLDRLARGLGLAFGRRG
jgi:transcriptional regulator with XRE-family HTH domain